MGVWGGEGRAAHRGCVIYRGPGPTPGAQPPADSGVHSIESSQPGQRRWVGVPTKPLSRDDNHILSPAGGGNVAQASLPVILQGLVTHGLTGYSWSKHWFTLVSN